MGRWWLGGGVSAVLVCAQVGAPGCAVDGADARVPVAALPASRDGFDREAGLLIAKKCGDAGCHGRAERPFALFATGARRMDPTETHLKTALRPQEVDANYASTLGFVDSTQPRETTLLKKAVGLLGHKGGYAFEAPSDPMAKAIAAWLTGVEVP